jgi:ribosomal subunit interface protein
MKIQLAGKNISWSESLRRHVARALDFALDRFEGRIRNIDVLIDCEAGINPNISCRCRIDVHLHRHEPVRVEVLDAEPYTAIDRAADMAAHVLTRHLTRVRTLQRKSA